MATTNKICSLLDKQDNEQMITLLGIRCQCLAMSVVQLFVTEPPLHSQWIKKDTGILCFVKDNFRKDYFFRLYCLKRNSMVWEQEIYKNMEYNTSCEFLHTFEGEGCMVAFNFANIQEAREQKVVVDRKLLSERRREAKREKKKSKSTSNSASITNPSNFRHISHIGLDSERGFIFTGDDPQLNTILQRVGISQNQQNGDTQELIINQPEEREIGQEQISESQDFDRPPLPPKGINRINNRSQQSAWIPRHLEVTPTPLSSTVPLPSLPQPSAPPLLGKFAKPKLNAKVNAAANSSFQDTKEEFEYKARSVCVICLDEDATHLVVPCGHKIYCRNCASVEPIANAKRCPVCNGKHTMVIMVRE